MDENLRRLEAEARRRVDAVSDDPQGRYRMREAFYQRFGEPRRPELNGFGNSELAFLRYEIERGVLNPVSGDSPGSPWWRKVNSTLLYAAELATLIVDSGATGAAVGHPVRAWLDYIAEPSGERWYRAHNTSIVRGYIDAVSEARAESSDEQYFMNEVLYRLLFAEALVNGAALGEFGQWIADPRLPAVDIMVHLPAFYPRHYPMTAAEAIDVHHQGHGLDEDLARLLDQVLIIPHLTRLYYLLAGQLELPELEQFVRDGKPVYPPPPAPPPGPRKKVIILGAGASALAAAWELTRHPGWRERYDVTVQVLGWRVGGKTATGRGPFDRIEEHGIHILQGWYDVTFAMLKEVYDERRDKKIDPRAPFQQWQDGFEPNNSTLLTEWIPGRGWVNWPLIFPTNPATPGEGPPLTTWQLIKKLVAMALEMLLGSPYDPDQGPLARWLLDHFFPPGGGGLTGRLGRFLGGAAAGAAGHLIVSALAEAVEHLDDDLEGPIDMILGILEGAVSWLEEHVDPLDPDHDRMRRLLLIIELVLVNLRGILADVWVPPSGGSAGHFAWDRIDNLDYREWIARHGAGSRVLDSVVVRFFYTGTFANLAGPWGEGGRLAAGTALRFVLASAGYKGSFVYQFKAGTGDTMIMPFFEVLSARGVKFEFFREVKSVERPAAAGGPVERVVVAEQVTLRNEVYDPTVRVKGLKAWPAKPLYEQIDPAQAEELRERDVDLESPWADWEPPVVRTLERGRDFDEVILALPVGTLRTVCSSFHDDARWRTMLDGVQTTATMSLQLWLRPDLGQLGFDRAQWGLAAKNNAPNVVVYQSPLYSWLDSTLVRPWESWPTDQNPGLIAYFTGAMSDPAVTPGFDVHTYPELARTHLAGLTQQWLRDNMAWFWPKGARREAPSGLDPSLLVGPVASANAAERQAFQYVRANVDPWQRYTLSVPGSARARLRADGSGYANLWLAGDWIDFGMNVGYIEGALRSGLQAGEALRRSLGLDGGTSLEAASSLGPQGRAAR